MNRDIPQKVSIEMIKAAKEYASVDAGGFIVNDPRQYKAFRDGQDYGYLLAVSLSHQGENQRGSVATESARGVAADPQIIDLQSQISNLSANCMVCRADRDGLRKENTDLLAEVERLRGEREAPQWISVKDRLPEPFQDVLGWIAYKEEIRSIYHTGSAWFNDDLGTPTVTHWMPEPTKPHNP